MSKKYMGKLSKIRIDQQDSGRFEYALKEYIKDANEEFDESDAAQLVKWIDENVLILQDEERPKIYDERIVDEYNELNDSGVPEKDGRNYCQWVWQTKRHRAESAISSILELNYTFKDKEILDSNTEDKILFHLGVSEGSKELQNSVDLISKIFASYLLLNVRVDGKRKYLAEVFTLFDWGLNYLKNVDDGISKNEKRKRDGVIYAMIFLLTNFVDIHAHKFLSANIKKIEEFASVLNEKYRGRVPNDQKSLASLVFIEKVRGGKESVFNGLYEKMLFDIGNTNYSSSILSELERVLHGPEKEITEEIRHDAFTKIVNVLDKLSSHENRYKTEEYIEISHLLMSLNSNDSTNIYLSKILEFYSDIEKQVNLDEVDPMISVNYCSYLSNEFSNVNAEDKQKIFDRFEKFYLRIPRKILDADFFYKAAYDSMKKQIDTGEYLEKYKINFDSIK